ncbi:MAG: glutathione peroxidase [Phycisphaeraceae bacterium]|nr:glutathione peroxidase [Phycisphaeraceae bacterium]
MLDIDGNEVDLSKYKGQVIMIVNVASKCGYTPQYAGLEKLYKEKSGKGFVILGFPANDFGEQEPGTNSEIKAFCSTKYNVTFPMFSKISVRGNEKHPLYKKLSGQPKPLGGEGVPGWNFTKFLVDRQGNVVARFDSKIKPDDPTLVKKVDELLESK